MEILKYPDPRLTAPNAAVEAFGPEEAKKVEEMFRLMGEVGGIGLAAPQVGWNVRLFVAELPERTSDGGPIVKRPVVFFNPSVEIVGEKTLLTEGCLSFPEVFAKVPRGLVVQFRAQTPEGKANLIAAALVAQAFQHEIDHLDGILYIDRMPADERARIEPQLEALRAKWKQ